MADSKKLSIIIGAIDKLSGPMSRINKTIEKIKGPVDRANRSLNKLGRASGLKQFNRSLKKAAKNARKAAKAVKGIGKLGVIGGLGASTAIAGLAKSYADSGDKIAKTAFKLGYSVEDYQRRIFAADRSGVEASVFEKSVQKLGTNAADAANGLGEARKAFQALGIEVETSQGKMKGTDNILLETLDALNRVKDEVTRNGLAEDILGARGVAMVQMGKDGAEGIRRLGDEADQLGLVMSGKAAQNAEKFTDSLTDLGGVFTGLRNRIGEQLLPVLIPLIDKFKEIAIKWGPELSQWSDNFAKKMPENIRVLKQEFSGLITSLKGIIDAGKWVSEHFGLMNTAFAIVGTLIAGSLVTAVSSLTGVFWALGAALLGTPIGWIIGGIAVLIAIGATLYRNWDKIIEYWDKIVMKFNAEFPFDTVGNSIQSLAKIVAQYNPFSVLLKSINSVLKALTGFDILNKIQTKLQNLLPAWAVKTLGLGDSVGVIQAPIPGTKNEVGGKLKIEIDNKGNARIKDIQTNNPNVAIHADVGQAMNTSGASVYRAGYSQFAIGG